MNTNDFNNRNSLLNYEVMYCTPIESWSVAAFKELNDAKSWCEKNVKGQREYCSDDTDDCHNNHHWYEVYDIRNTDEDNPVGDMAYETNRFYHD